MLGVFRVKGDSMVPTLDNGDYVVAFSWPGRPKPGRLMVIDHPRYGVIIKRLVKAAGGGYWFASDNPQGITEKEIGEIRRQQIVGRVLFVVRQRKRAA